MVNETLDHSITILVLHCSQQNATFQILGIAVVDKGVFLFLILYKLTFFIHSFLFSTKQNKT